MFGFIRNMTTSTSFCTQYPLSIIHYKLSITIIHVPIHFLFHIHIHITLNIHIRIHIQLLIPIHVHIHTFFRNPYPLAISHYKLFLHFFYHLSSTPPTTILTCSSCVESSTYLHVHGIAPTLTAERDITAPPPSLSFHTNIYSI